MRGPRLAAAVAVALVVPSLAAAQSVERVRVAGPGVTSAFPRGVSLELVSPSDYTRRTAAGTEGSWTGPAYWASGDRSVGGTASMQWTVTFDAKPASAKAAALAATTRGWPLDKKDSIAVPHYVGKRDVGTILGYYVITRGLAPKDASYEAALAFPVAPNAYSIVRFEALDPATDSAGTLGSYLVGGSVLPSYWNRGQIFWAFSGVRLVGNLPPTNVSLIRAAGRRLTGVVADAFRHPVLGVPVSLQIQLGSSWRQLTKTKTDENGAFSIRVGRKGTYRAVASSRGQQVASPAVSVA
jgi:hypothetical protein